MEKYLADHTYQTFSCKTLLPRLEFFCSDVPDTFASYGMITEPGGSCHRDPFRSDCVLSTQGE